MTSPFSLFLNYRENLTVWWVIATKLAHNLISGKMPINHQLAQKSLIKSWKGWMSSDDDNKVTDRSFFIVYSHIRWSNTFFWRLAFLWWIKPILNILRINGENLSKGPQRISRLLWTAVLSAGLRFNSVSLLRHVRNLCYNFPTRKPAGFMQSWNRTSCFKSHLLLIWNFKMRFEMRCAIWNFWDFLKLSDYTWN